MVSQEDIDPPPSAPRISFSADFLDENDFISIHPDGHFPDQETQAKETPTVDLGKKPRNGEFEFLAASMSTHKMMTADELFFEGKLLPFWQMQQSERLKRITLKPKSGDSEEARDGGRDQERVQEEEKMRNSKNSSNRDQDQEQNRVSWLLDDDPSPRPPKCTVLWKELLRLKTKRASSSLSPSPSSSSTSSSSSSLGDVASMDERKEARDRDRESNSNYVQRIRKGLERTRSNSIRIRPMVNVPICTHVKSASGGGSLPPLFPLKKGRV
ncbi:uncharacterized protein LOC130140309 [Syzygium oleosum]|uniref:uncharacterized protein LOC115688737 n=1 Tax=Syzygium oleosum TaxID=219896 RepID=UPI0011D23A12|nr:uncharacterized protein LOC115688737 [Syzygium oleosum]XP_056175369.1 uncharacterized protein LOC130140309 [Syzygium oleosum]